MAGAVPPVSQLATAWDPAPLVLAGAAVAALRFAYAFRRLRRRGRADRAGWSRAALFGCGLALVVGPLVSPLDPAGDGYLLSAHMLQHMLIGDAGPALIVVSLRGPLLAFMLPAGAVRFVNRRPLLHRFAAWLNSPFAAIGIWAAAFACWHVPSLYDAALHRAWLHDLEHLSFVSCGILVWTQLVDPARRGRLSVGQRAATAGALFFVGQILSGVLLLTSTPLYPYYADQPVRLFGLGVMGDQQYAGLVMMAEQLVTLGTCIALLGFSLLKPARRPAPLAAAI